MRAAKTAIARIHSEISPEFALHPASDFFSCRKCLESVIASFIKFLQKITRTEIAYIFFNFCALKSLEQFYETSIKNTLCAVGGASYRFI